MLEKPVNLWLGVLCDVVISFWYFIPCTEFKIFKILHMIMFLLNNIISSLLVNENIMIYLQFPNPTNINV